MFNVDEQTLTALFRAYHFPLPGAEAVLFSVRGALPIDASGTGFAAQHALDMTAGVDYRNMRCTMGVWKPGAGLAVFPGSTVPHARYLTRALGFIHRGEANNKLLAGYHRNYAKGPHPRDSGSTHRALRNDGHLPVLRAWDGDLGDLRNEDIRFNQAYDNIHCAYAYFAPDGGKFESKGCQVIAGFGKRKDGKTPAALGPWAKFDAIIYDQLSAQDRFGYALMDARPVRAVAMGVAPPRIALRYGSEGPAVKRLQQALVQAGASRAGSDPPGVFLFETLKALIDWQGRSPAAGGVDGVAGVNSLRALGLDDLVLGPGA
jgi:hypothetical protein